MLSKTERTCCCSVRFLKTWTMPETPPRASRMDVTLCSTGVRRPSRPTSSTNGASRSPRPIPVSSWQTSLTCLPSAIILRPSGHHLRNRVHEPDDTRRVGADHGIGDGTECGGEPTLVLAQPAVHGALVQRHLDGRVEFTFFKRLEDIAERPGQLRTLERHVVRMGGHEDHRDIGRASDLLGGFHAIHRPFQRDIHEDDVRKVFAGQGDRIRTGTRHPHHIVPDAVKTAAQIVGHDPLILNDKYPCPGHDPCCVRLWGRSLDEHMLIPLPGQKLHF